MGYLSCSASHRGWFRVCLAALLFSQLLAVQAMASLTVTPITWDVVGLDHNRPLTSGPELFPVGARVCSDTDTSNVEVQMVWDQVNAFIATRPGSLSAIQTGPLSAGECFDAYFEIQLQRSAAAFGQSRRYRILATDGDTGQTFSSPTPRAIYIERLVSQNRNQTNQIRWGQQADQSDWVTLGAGGGLNLAVGETYFIELTTQTATAYEQLQSFLTLSNTIFQVKSVETTYGTLTAPPSRVPVPNPSLYADGCRWDPDPNSPNYLSCLSAGKAGGVVVTVYEIDIISGGGDSVGLLALIYDKSGGSYHYNTDFSKSPGEIIINDPTNAGFAKRFIPSTIGADGTTTLRFTISNPNPFTVGGYRFTDVLPGNMVVANPANASSSCGGTVTAPPGSGVIGFEGGTIGANATCTILVTVTVPFSSGASYPVTLDNVADLFVGDATNPSATAAASLIVTETPPPPVECQNVPAGTQLARWSTFNSTLTPSPTFQIRPGIASAQGAAGLLFTVVNPEWRAEARVTNQTLAQARSTSAYYEFRLDTTGLTSVDFRLEAFRRNGNAPATITLDYGPAGSPLVQSTTMTPVPTQANRPGASNFLANGLTNLNPNGITVFRVYAYSATNTNQPISFLEVSLRGQGEICAPVPPGEAPNPPVLAKTFNPNPIRRGAVSTLSFGIQNPNSTRTLTDIAFRDELPPGMLAVGNLVNDGCGGTWGLDGGNPSVLVLTGASLAGGASCSLSVDVSSTTVGANTNVSDPIDSRESFPGNSAVAVLNVLPPPAPPSIAKFFETNPLLDPNGSTRLVFEVRNNDANLAISQVAFADPLPAGLVPAEDPIEVFDNGNCGPYMPAYDGGTNTLSFSGGVIAAGQTCRLELDVAVPGLEPADLAAVFFNQTGNVTHVFEGITYSGNQAEATLLVDEPIPEIAILKQVGPSADPEGIWSNYLAVEPGDEVHYRLIIENIGETVLTNITVVDLDVDTSTCPWEQNPTFELPVADADDPEGHIAECIVGPVSAVEGVIVNLASASAQGAGQTVQDQDSATYATTGLAMDKSADPLYYTAAGEVIDYSFTVTNIGHAILQGPVEIDDPLIGGIVCPSLNSIGNLDNLFDPGETLVCSGSYVTTAQDVDDGFVVNVAFAFTPEAASEPDEAVVIRLGTNPALTVEKMLVSPPDPIVVGSVLSYLVTATNTGDTVLSDVLVSDPLLDPANEFCPLLELGQSCVLSGTYTVTQADVDAGQVLNVGTAVSNESDPSDDSVDTPLDQNPAIDLDKQIVAGDPYAGIGDVISYSIAATNTGNVTLSGVSISDPLAVLGACTPAQPATLAPGDSLVCQASYAITQADIDAGSFTNTATVVGSDPNANPLEQSDQATASGPAIDPAITLSKIILAGDPYAEVGDVISYQITATNIGNVSLFGASISDPDAVLGTCTPAQPTDLAPGGDLVCQASYVVTQADINAGSFTNTATVGAVDAQDNPIGDSDSATAEGPDAAPGLSVAKALTDAPDPIVEGSVLTYTVTATNTGNVTLNNVIVSDSLITPSSTTCATVAVGDSCVLTGTYTVDQTDIDAGQIQNTGTANSDETGPEEDTVTTPINQDPALEVAKAMTDAPDPIVEGSVLTYTVTATNIGNITLTNVVVSDNLITPASVTCTTVVVGDTCVLTGTYTVDQTDIDAGQIQNTGTANSDETGPEEDTVTTPIDQDPALTVTKALTEAPDPIVEGSVLTYTVTATNTGNVTLNNVVVSDSLITPDSITCPSVAVGDSCVLTGTYTVDQSDIDAGQIQNTGTANSDETGPEEDTVTTPVDQDPALTVAKALTDAPDPIEEGSVLTYTVTATNTGNVTLNNVVVSDSLITPDNITCVTVAVGDSCVLTGTYTVDQADIDAGQIMNTGTANSDEAGPEEDTVTTPIDQDPALTVAKALTDAPDPIVEGSVLTYTVTASNTGNVTLTNVVVSDNLITPSSITCATVAVGGTCVLIGTYTVDQADIDAGEIQNTGTANSDETDPEQDTVTTPIDQAPALEVAKALTDAPDPIVEGSVLTYTVTATNTGNVTLTNVVVSDSLITPDSITCVTVAVGDSCVLTGTYTVDQADIDAGEIQNTGTADSDDTGPEEDTITTPIDQNPALEVTKALTNAPDPIVEGSVLTYTVTATNIGNITLTNVVVSDNLITPASVTCTTVAVGDTCVLTGTYTVTQGDVDAGQIQNTGAAESEEAGPEEDTVTTPIDQEPELSLAKLLTDAPAPIVEGSVLTYTLTATNTGNVSLMNVVVSDDLITPSSVTCATLEVGDDCVLVGTYTVTQADVDLGEIENTGTAFSDETPDPIEDTVVTPIEAAPAVELSKVVTAGDPFSAVGDVIEFEITATNIGNVTLVDVSISDPDAVLGACMPAQPAELAPGESLVCEASFTITQAEIDAGSFTNTATVTAMGPNDEPVEDSDSATAVEVERPSVSVTKSSDPTSGSPVLAGDTITYTIEVVVTNAPLGDTLELTDTLSAGLTLETVSAGDFDCGFGSPLVCSLSSGTEPGTYVLSYAASVDQDASGTLTNAVVVSEPGGDPDPGCESCSTEHPVQTLGLGVVTEQCINDVPYVAYQLDLDGFPDPEVTIRWIAIVDDSNAVVEELTMQPESGQLLWPGAAVDGAGNGIAWPGWDFDPDTGWFEVPTNLRPEMLLEFSVNPTVGVVVEYPPATPQCSANPPLDIEFRPPVPVNSASRTSILLLILLLLAAGATALRPRAPA